jgi:hypothetical protein
MSHISESFAKVMRVSRGGRSSSAVRVAKVLGCTLAVAAVVGGMGPAVASAAVDGAGVAIRINAGGPAYVDRAGNTWQADTGFNTGGKTTVNAAIAATDEDLIYQSNRYDKAGGPELAYAIDVPNGEYRVNLHFAETWSGAWSPGKRVFDVHIEGQQVEQAFDVFAAAGANTALVKSYTVRVDDGRLDIGFTGRVQNPMISGIEVLAQKPAVLRVNAGGGQYVDRNGNTWLADHGFNEGSRATTDGAIAGTDDASLYQTNRYDVAAAPELEYAFDVPNGDYLVKLHFAETWQKAFKPGVRVFGVTIEDETVESALDVYAAAGANTAMVRSYPVTVADGRLQIGFVHKVQNPMVSGIEIIPWQPMTIRVNAGGGEYVDRDGRTWSADQGFNTGATARVSAAIAGTEDDELYLTNRYDKPAAPELSYAFEVPNGDYRVNLHFAETWSNGWTPGKRMFDVRIEGVDVDKALDVFALAGANTALVRSYTTRVEDGELQIEFLHRVQNPNVSAIEILALSNHDGDEPSEGDSGPDGDPGVPGDGTDPLPDPNPEPQPNVIPMANTDAAAVEDGVASLIDVLANDTGLDNQPVAVSIVASPGHGTAWVRPDNTVVYTADAGYAGTDGFTYQVTDADGEVSLANVSIEVSCPRCVVDYELTLSWTSNPGDILGYQVFRGPTANEATQLIADLPLNSGLLDPRSPSVRFRAHADLGLGDGEQACFRVKAYTHDAESDYSAPVCRIN